MKDQGAEVTRKEKRLKILATDEIESIYNRGTAGIRAKWDTMQSFVNILAIMQTLWF